MGRVKFMICGLFATWVCWGAVLALFDSIAEGRLPFWLFAVVTVFSLVVSWMLDVIITKRIEGDNGDVL